MCCSSRSSQSGSSPPASPSLLYTFFWKPLFVAVLWLCSLLPLIVLAFALLCQYDTTQVTLPDAWSTHTSIVTQATAIPFQLACPEAYFPADEIPITPPDLCLCDDETPIESSLAPCSEHQLAAGCQATANYTASVRLTPDQNYRVCSQIDVVTQHFSVVSPLTIHVSSPLSLLDEDDEHCPVGLRRCGASICWPIDKLCPKTFSSTRRSLTTTEYGIMSDDVLFLPTKRYTFEEAIEDLGAERHFFVPLFGPVNHAINNALVAFRSHWASLTSDIVCRPWDDVCINWKTNPLTNAEFVQHVYHVTGENLKYKDSSKRPFYLLMRFNDEKTLLVDGAAFSEKSPPTGFFAFEASLAFAGLLCYICALYLHFNISSSAAAPVSSASAPVASAAASVASAFNAAYRQYRNTFYTVHLCFTAVCSLVALAYLPTRDFSALVFYNAELADTAALFNATFILLFFSFCVQLLACLVFFFVSATNF